MTTARTRYDRAAIALGAAAIAAAISVLLPLPGVLNFIRGGLVGIIVLAVGGVVAIVGGVLASRLVASIAGIVLAGAALGQLVSLPFGALLGGDASLVAVLGGLGIGLLVVCLGPRGAASPTS